MRVETIRRNMVNTFSFTVLSSMSTNKDALKNLPLGFLTKTINSLIAPSSLFWVGIAIGTENILLRVRF